ncbi:hypothetical protein GCM10010973_30420 [Cribrihabitans marinus]|nr:hypothetical protein GCM10010973_30420 [Cribrihabitans marinus]
MVVADHSDQEGLGQDFECLGVRADQVNFDIRRDERRSVRILVIAYSTERCVTAVPSAIAADG